ncbi:MAG: glycosyltransferase family 9 protein [Candidatus Marinimicrobia bacterium]|jgi:heptosyltransferase-2|nr:glycosyltransferase family 9 protein [Candidatus Neomarinimicrobiota bacterium]MDP6593202.1 glycosyltransferase family 9 protein [Candidatus Neomarinimicrobiota bacterium]MDP6835993.1 glycosyltransferase family 9 protein [Candidatus Neomarinimicrobiota bacterium]|tara:strand:+ start:7265 stop:8281 length:1017 start_codon:yes stop_codon:yes gene_type:complete
MLKRYLLVRFSSIGDVVLTTSLIELLAGNQPRCEIHFITLDRNRPILEGNPHLTKIISLPADTAPKALRNFAAQLSNYDYDVCLDLHNSLRSKYLRWRMKDCRWNRFSKPRLSRFLLFYLTIDRFHQNYEVTREYANLIQNGSIEERVPPPRIYLSDEEHNRVDILLANEGVRDDFVVVVPSAAWKAKEWSPQAYGEMIALLKQKTGMPVVLLGTQDSAACDQVHEANHGTVNLKGRTGLREAFATLSRARLVVGGDTGLVHASEAVGTPVVMITGPTSWQTGAHVRHTSSGELAADVWCRPCSKDGSRSCYRSRQYCMTEISAEMVAKAAMQILAEA